MNDESDNPTPPEDPPHSDGPGASADAPGEGDPADPDAEADPRAPNPEVRWPFWAGLAISLLVHAVAILIGPVLSMFGLSMSSDVEWLHEPRELESIGQSTGPREASLARASTNEAKNEKENEKKAKNEALEGLDKKALEEAMKKAQTADAKEKSEPEEADEPDSTQPKETDRTIASRSETDAPASPAPAPRQKNDDPPEDTPPKKDTKKAAPPKDPSDTKEPAEPDSAPDAPDAPEKTKDAKKRADTPARPGPLETISDHPALDRAGPNDLPDMRSFAPGDALVSTLIRLKPVRGKVYESAVRNILRRVPDYRILAEATELDPTAQIDSFFMASADPRYVQNSFLAVRHNLGAKRVRTVLDGRYPNPPAWQEYKGVPMRDIIPKIDGYRDPRKILVPNDELVVVSKAKWLDGLVAPLADGSRLLERGPDAPESDQGRTARNIPKKDRPTMLQAVDRVHEVARRDDTIVLFSAKGIGVDVPGLGVQAFKTLRMAVTRPDRPTLDLDLGFSSKAEARRFAAACPKMKRRLTDAVPGSAFLGIDAAVDELGCRHDGTYVNVHGQFDPQQIADLAGLAEWVVPAPPALDSLPSPPPEDEK